PVGQASSLPSPQTSKTPAPRRSPLHRLPAAGTAPEGEAAVLTLALCDLSSLPPLGVRGPAAESWLRSQGVEVPRSPYDTLPLGGGLIIRCGPGDFFLEGGLADATLPRLSAELDRAPRGVYRVERQDAAFLLTGVRAAAVLAQVCSIDFATA